MTVLRDIDDWVAEFTQDAEYMSHFALKKVTTVELAIGRVIAEFRDGTQLRVLFNPPRFRREFPTGELVQEVTQAQMSAAVLQAVNDAAAQAVPG